MTRQVILLKCVCGFVGVAFASRYFKETLFAFIFIFVFDYGDENKFGNCQILHFYLVSYMQTTAIRQVPSTLRGSDSCISGNDGCRSDWLGKKRIPLRECPPVIGYIVDNDFCSWFDVLFGDHMKVPS